MDGIDSGLEGFVQPGFTMIYKDYPGETFAEQYGAAFNENGGWDTVWTQVAVGSAMSAVSEAGQLFKRKGSGSADGGAKPDGDGNGVSADTKKTASDYLDSGKSPKECAADLRDAVERGEITPDEAMDALNKKCASMPDNKQKAEWHPDRYQHDIEVAGQKAAAGGATPEAGNTPNVDGGARPDTDGGARPDTDGGTKPETGLSTDVKPDSDIALRPDADGGARPDIDGGAKPDVDSRTWRDKFGDAVDNVRNADYANNIHPSGVVRDMTETVLEGEPHGIDAGFGTPVSDEPYVPANQPAGDDIQYREDLGTDPTTPTTPTTPMTPVDPTTPIDPTNPVDPTTPIDPTNPVDPTTPINPTNPVDPTTPIDPTNPVNPSVPNNPTDPGNPYNPGNGGHTGSGFGGDDEFNGSAFSLDDEFGDDFDSIADIISRGSGNIPSSSSPLKSDGKGVSAFIPISAGLSAAAAVGLGTKALLDKKNNDDEDEGDDNLESYLFEDEEDVAFDESFDDDDESFIPDELLLED